MDQKFVIGDKVWMKNIDGPPMVINGYVNPGVWSCKWYDGKKFCFETLNEKVLTKENPGEISSGQISK